MKPMDLDLFTSSALKHPAPTIRNLAHELVLLMEDLFSLSKINTATECPLSKPFAFHLAARGVADGIMEWTDQPPATGFLDITPEFVKDRLRILNDTLWLNAQDHTADTTPLGQLLSTPSQLQAGVAGFTYAATWDLEKSFYQILLPLDVRQLFGAAVEKPDGTIAYVRMTRLGMGYLKATDILQRVSLILHNMALDALAPLGDTLFFTDVYVDNGSLFSNSYALCKAYLTTIIDISKKFGITIGEIQWPSVNVPTIHRGLSLDLKRQTVMLKPSMLQKIHERCLFAESNELNLAMAEELTGLLVYADQCLNVHGAKRIHSLISDLILWRHSATVYRALSAGALLEIRQARLWSTLAGHLRNFLPTPTIILSDACDSGGAVVVVVGNTCHGFAWQWSLKGMKLHINEQELFPIALCRLFTDEALLPVIDNTVAVFALNNRYSPSTTIQKWLRHSLTQANPTSALWCSTHVNPLDSASRGQLHNPFIRLNPYDFLASVTGWCDGGSSP
jgi:hypothetical protein